MSALRRQTAASAAIGSKRDATMNGLTRDQSALAERIAALGDASYAELHAEWRRLWRSAAPKKLSRDILELGIAWKLQEQAFGGIDAKTRRRLARIAASYSDVGQVQPAPVRLQPGARLLRQWRGETHEVIVLEDGFEWRGKPWTSLSLVAREITGVHRSGPLFFGLKHKSRSGDAA